MKALLKHSAIYLLARGLPGVVNFLAIALYTRLLSPDEYGRYALVIAGTGLANVVLFEWLAMAVLRYLPGQEGSAQLLATIRSVYRWLMLATALAGLPAVLCTSSEWRWLLISALPLLWTQGWFEINLQILRAQLAPAAYGLVSGLKAIVAVAGGGLLLQWYPVALAPVLGHIAGFLLSSATQSRALWRSVRAQVDLRLAKQIMHYGMPLSATLALSYLVNSSDRFLIAYFIDDRAAGIYAAGYDLTSQILTMLMLIVNTAAFPLILNDLEQRGIAPARQQLLHNIFLLMAVAAPFTAGMILFAPEVARTVLGHRFQDTAISLIPWIALATLLNGLRSYHFDLAFQLGKHTVHQLWVMGVALLVNVILNLIWIPQKGILGAAWSTLAAYLCALLASIVIGRRFFPVPTNWRGIARVGIAVLAMLLVWQVMPRGSTLLHQALLATVVLLVYSGVLVALTQFHYPYRSLFRFRGYGGGKTVRRV